MIEITLSTVMGQRLGLRGVFGARILPMAVVTTMNGAKAGHGRMTCRRADSHSAGFGFVSNPCPICWIPEQHLETLLAVFIQNASNSMCFLKCIMCHSGLRQRQKLWKKMRWECPEFVLSLSYPSPHTRLGHAKTMIKRQRNH